MIPQVDFFGRMVSRLVLGDNPVHGHTYIPEIFSREDMLQYYSEQNFIADMRLARSVGCNAHMLLANEFTLRALLHDPCEERERNLIFQSYPPMDFKTNVREMAAFHPAGIYHQGTTTDGFCEEGKHQVVRDRIKRIHDAGVKAGIGTHVPETVLRAEDEDWGVDFYVTCLHNTRIRGDANESSFITGKPKHLKFFMEDRPAMYEAIRAVPKPFIAFKIFAGGQIFYHQSGEALKQAAKRAFEEAYANIKPSDVCCMGCFQRDKNQIAENAELVREILGNG
ncbi:MAG: hypothetical protein FWG37_05095 [Clostridia bacterium]|nr:hypothetical protein [Clostridia bacterium]